MNGLEMARAFHAHCRPILAEHLGGLLPQTAAGLAGEGSECFGCDDEISRDHDYGPGFCLWIEDDLLQANKDRISLALAALPSSYCGMPVRMQAPGRTGVMGIRAFYHFFTGLPEPPAHWRDWLPMPEYQLAAATNGEVFDDGTGFFSRWRKILLDFYPQDVWLKKLAARTMIMAQTGQYNLPRSLRRQDHAAAMLAAARFAEAALSFVFLINRHYMPFYKWAPRLVARQPILGGACAEMIDFLASRPLNADTAPAISGRLEDFCAACASFLRAAGLSNEASAWLWPHGAQIAAKIANPELRSRNILMD